jgi:hypothetical protein
VGDVLVDGSDGICVLMMKWGGEARKAAVVMMML